MKSPVLSVYLENETEAFPVEIIKSLSIHASIFSSFPAGEIIIDDPEGRVLASLVTKPGNTITVAFADGDPDNSTLASPQYFCPLYITGSSNPGVYTSDNDQVQLGSLGGVHKLNLGHIWALRSDWSNHAYRAKASEIIRQVVTGSKRGFRFTNITIDPTDDTGNITRYKLGESESQFIHQKIMPYATIDKQAAYSFVDELGGFHLQSFFRMYNQESKAIILPPVSDSVASLWDNEATLPQLPIYDGSWSIGSKFAEQLANFKKVIYVEDSASQISFVANLPYKAAIPGYTLVKKEYVDNVQTTAAAIYPFRNFEDAIRLNINNNAVMNEFFTVSVTVGFAPELAITGQPVTLKLAGYDPTTDHWMNGKWLVASSDHFLRDGMYYTKYMLCRPALDTLPASVDPASLYKS